LSQNEEQYFIALDQSVEMNLECDKFLLEPIGRNTAPAIALASFNSNYDDILLVLPSDHLIKNIDEYKSIVKKAKEFANDGYLVTFGITPTEPNTGYGYIEAKNYDVKPL